MHLAQTLSSFYTSLMGYLIQEAAPGDWAIESSNPYLCPHVASTIYLTIGVWGITLIGTLWESCFYLYSNYKEVTIWELEMEKANHLLQQWESSSRWIFCSISCEQVSSSQQLQEESELDMTCVQVTLSHRKQCGRWYPYPPRSPLKVPVLRYA